MTRKLFFITWLFLAFAASAQAAPSVLHHDLRLRIHPQEQALTGTDRVTVAPDGARHLIFSLAPQAEVQRVTSGGEELEWNFRGGELTVVLPPGQPAKKVPVEIRYRGTFTDQAPETPLNAEDPSYGVTGAISPQGTFLGGDAGWYPEILGSLPGFRLAVEGPDDLVAVSSGRLVEQAPGRTVWEADYPVRGIALAAGPYRRHSGRAGEVPVEAFFYPQSGQFAETYLRATEEYLRLYQGLFGPYPFRKFAVAENFFPTGYGYPSWTLLGSTVVRLPFIVETSLGHEVAHSWWGNGVWVDYGRGNWSEGLTTYVADHLYKERVSPEEAREYRLKILRDYAALVPPEKDIPLSDFLSRSTAAEQAVGYGKAAMVFHMARQRVGDQAFWAGLRQVAKEKMFRRASWSDFAAAFAPDDPAGMRQFFRQWVERPGAPVLALEGVTREETDSGWKVTGSLLQRGAPYDLQVPIRLETEGKPVGTVVHSAKERTSFVIESPARPQRLVVDPEVDVFRRLDISEIPAAVNGLKGSADLVAIVSAGMPPEVRREAALLLQGLGQRGARIVPEAEVSAADLRDHDLLFLGLPDNRGLLPPLPAGLQISAEASVLQGREYRGGGAVLFAALPHPSSPGRTAAVYLPGSPEAAATAARKIPHYGKYSYLAFVDGTNVEKGIWPVATSPVIHRFD